MCTFKLELTELKIELVLMKHIKVALFMSFVEHFILSRVSGRVCDTRTFTIAEIWLAVCPPAFSQCRMKSFGQIARRETDPGVRT